MVLLISWRLACVVSQRCTQKWSLSYLQAVPCTAKRRMRSLSMMDSWAADACDVCVAYPPFCAFAPWEDVRKAHIRRCSTPPTGKLSSV
ncbi:hypothetical protein IWX49DRAFT_571185 [Phyllosticta citricarpa]